MNPLFTSPGSKTRLAQRLIAMYPRHRTYVEPFAGGAACFWRKTRSPIEVLNDYDPDVAQAYQVVRDVTARQLNGLMTRDWVVSEEGFARSLVHDPDPIEDTYRFLYRRRASFGSRERTLHKARVGKSLPVPKHLARQNARLRGVQVFQGDALALMKEYDRPGVFMFIDPPWPGYHWKWKHYQMKHIEELLDVLGNLQVAQWLYAETTTLTDTQLIPASWHTNRLTYMGTGYSGKRTERTELILSNYEVNV